jgi:tetratricopeptide (TPR) repeat protein
MAPISRFRGTGGEIVRGYISPFTYFSALPFAIIMLLLGLGIDQFTEYRKILTLPVLYAFSTAVTMRFAIPASRGDSEPSNDINEIFAYSGRYLILTLAWYIPWQLAWGLFDEKSAVISPFMMMNPQALLKSAWILLYKLALLLLALLLPSLCLLVSLYSHNVEAIFKKDSWDWLLNRRRDDLPAYLSHLAGSCLLMLFCSLLPALIIIYLAFQGSTKAGINVAGFIYIWYAATVPILTGRLAGAFVAEELPQATQVMHDNPAAPFSAPLTVAMPETPKIPPEPKPDMGEIEQRLAQLDDNMLPDALAAATEMESSQTAPIRGQIEQAILSIRLGDQPAACDYAVRAIDNAAQRGFGDISIRLFEKMGTERRKLKLAPYSFEIIGNIFQQRKNLLEAAWCYHAAATSTGDTLKAQKRLFQIAEIAEKSGNHADALTLYEVLIKQYPDSTLVEFARQGVSRTKSQV